MEQGIGTEDGGLFHFPLLTGRHGRATINRNMKIPIAFYRLGRFQIMLLEKRGQIRS